MVYTDRTHTEDQEAGLHPELLHFTHQSSNNLGDQLSGILATK